MTSNQISKIKNLRSRFIADGFSSGTSCYVKKAKGAIITDIENRKYIDFSGGIAVMNVGHSQPKVISAIKEQAEKFTHTCFMVAPYISAIKLAEKLSLSVPGKSPKKVVFVNSGVEAVENAIKIARYYSKKPAIIAFENAFHGRTLLGMTLTSKVKPYKYGFGPYAPEVYRIPFAYCYRCSFNLKYPQCDLYCADYLNEFLITNVAPESTAAIIVEPIQGEGGFIVPPDGYFQKLKKICKQNKLLFIADEIQTGMGRTGEMFAMKHWNIEADLTIVAKSLAAGMPLSAVIGIKGIMDSVHKSGVGGTYGGNPVAVAAALAVFDIFETQNLLEKSKLLEKILIKSLNSFKTKYEIVGDIRGIGPMQAMELVSDRVKKSPATKITKELIEYCYKNGLIILSCGAYSNVIRFLMPLVTTVNQLKRGLSIIEEGLDKFTE